MGYQEKALLKIVRNSDKRLWGWQYYGPKAADAAAALCCSAADADAAAAADDAADAAAIWWVGGRCVVKDDV